MAKFGIGQAMRRSEDPRLLTGGGRYTDDIALDGQCHAYVLRSPHAHAAIRSLDTIAAAASPGVLAVITGADLERDGLGTIKCKAPLKRYHKVVRPTLATDTVRHVGDGVVLVVAETIEQARDAAELVEIDYEPLPAVVDMPSAQADGAPLVWDDAAGNVVFDWEMGDRAAADAAFAKADRVVSLDVINNRLVASSMEGRACIAAYDVAEERFTFYVSSQGVHGLRGQLADDIFHLPEDRFHVLTTDVGGGFGMKIFLYPEYVMALYAARKIARPVKWTADRSEAFLSDDHGRDNLTHVDLALSSDGKFLALKVDTVANLGAYLSNYGPFIPTEAGNQMLNGLYTFQAVHSHVRGVFTNTQPIDAYRGAGRPEAAYVLERVVDAAAREMGLSPAEIRLRNFIPPEAMPYRTATAITYDSGEFARNLNEAVQIADIASFPARRREALARNRLAGIGVSTYVEACAGGSAESATVTVDRLGKVTILIGTQTNGQGHETAYKQLVAEHLGVAPEDITVVQGDSDRIKTGGGTGGSRSVPVGGAAVNDAALTIQEKAKAAAGELLEASVQDIVFQDGRFAIVGTDRSASLADIARRSGRDVAFEEIGGFEPPESTFPNGAHVCEVEVDRDTGVVEIVRYTVVDDFGRVINPMMLEGQVHGGIAQGVGQALMEEAVFDGGSGQLVSGSFMDYAMPRADHLPFVTFKYNEVPCRTNPLGMKGAGEAGAIGAPPAVINAIVDALAEEHGVRHVDMPATPERVWRLIAGPDRRAAA